MPPCGPDPCPCPRSSRVVAGLVLLWAAAACGSRNPRILDDTREAAQAAPSNEDELSEPEKIRRLIAAVRECDDCLFIQGGQPRDGSSAAADLERRLARVPAGIGTARQFIDLVGAGRIRSKEADLIQLPDGRELELREWLLGRLAEAEGRSASANAQHRNRAASNQQHELGILDALNIVERSGLTFVAPPRQDRRGKTKGKPKTYTSREFSEMLRKKWTFLGADIHDLQTFIDQIATDAFTSFQPYEVVLSDGSRVEFRGWLLQQLEQRRQTLAASSK